MNKKIIFGQDRNRKKGDFMETLQKGALAITIIGAINWGLIGLFDFNLVEFLFGDMTLLSRIVYVLVALSGLINIGIFFYHLEDK